MRVDDFGKYLKQKKIFEINLLPPHKNEEEEEEDDDNDDDNDNDIIPQWYKQKYQQNETGPRKRIPGKKVFTDGIDDNIFDDENLREKSHRMDMKFGFDAMFQNAHYDVKNLAVLIVQLIETNRTLEIMDNETGKIFKFDGDIEVVGLLKRENYRNKKFDYDCILIRELSDNSMYVFSTETEDMEKSKFSFIFVKN